MPIVNDRFVDGAWRRDADFVTLDLEDSVPDTLKQEARLRFREAAAKVARGGSEVNVRINHDTLEEDVGAVMWSPLRRLWYPKCEHAEEVRRLDELMTRYEQERAIPYQVELVPMIESLLGVTNAYAIASSSERITSFGIRTGVYDLSHDLGVDMFVPFEQFGYQKGETELVARALGKQPFMSLFMPNPSGSVSDSERALRLAEAARKAGFRAGSGVHPATVEPQNRGFTPTASEVDRARWIVQQYPEIQSAPVTWSIVEGEVVDRYEFLRSVELLEWDDACRRMDAAKAEARRRVEQELSGSSSGVDG